MGGLGTAVAEWLSGVLLGDYGIIGLVTGLVIPVALLFADRFLIKAKRLNVRTLSDSNWPSRFGLRGKGQRISFVAKDGAPIEHPSMVSLRIKNSGVLDIAESDYELPVTVPFPDRNVIRAEIAEARSQDRADDQWRDMLAGHPGFKVRRHEVVLPPVHLNPRDRFKLVVLLSGESTGEELDCRGRIKGGRIIGDTHPRRITRTRVLAGFALLFAGALAVVLAVQPGLVPLPRQPFECATGDLTVVGSTAFEVAANKAKDAYLKVCDGANMTVNPEGSIDGLDQLRGADMNGRGKLLVLSDGHAPSGYPTLRARPTALAIFAVVVNANTGIDSLTLDQLRGIYSGQYDNWADLGGTNTEIRIVGRDNESGSRRTFEEFVLKAAEPAESSSNCERRDLIPQSATLRCLASGTGRLLENVNTMSGAIGYADAPTATLYPDVVRVRLDGREPEFGHIGEGYPFWTIEYMYTYGEPPAGGLLASFLAYMNTDSARVALREAGYVPCVNQDGSQLEPCLKQPR
ncbi:PstS family phosphate ABC transporter substrate-binding protein [Phytohabitans flavus]|uniref:PstS family phosphate ABC transporter substrate-binding protein n=1 Tax=Phytohabitans flavus TaxID=1076124 RepID=UPI003641733A